MLSDLKVQEGEAKDYGFSLVVPYPSDDDGEPRLEHRQVGGLWYVPSLTVDRCEVECSTGVGAGYSGEAAASPNGVYGQWHKTWQ